MSTEEAVSRERKLAEHQGDDRVVHWTEFLKERSLLMGKYVALNTGFPSFDEKMGGVLSSEVTVVSGRTGEGKTLLVESLVRNLMRKHGEAAKTCIFSYEMSPEFLLAKYADWPNAPMFLPLRLEAMDLRWLYDRIVEAKAKHDCRIFVFDHLHFLVDMATQQNMSLNIGGFMRQLKQKIAVGLNVACFLIAHQGKPEKSRRQQETPEPTIDEIRDSSLIAQEADNAILVWRRKDFLPKDINEIANDNPALASEIFRRTTVTDRTNKYANRFAMVQIAKARRTGTYRWSKLFQKVGDFLEEV